MEIGKKFNILAVREKKGFPGSESYYVGCGREEEEGGK